MLGRNFAPEITHYRGEMCFFHTIRVVLCNLHCSSFCLNRAWLTHSFILFIYFILRTARRGVWTQSRISFFRAGGVTGGKVNIHSPQEILIRIFTLGAFIYGTRFIHRNYFLYIKSERLFAVSCFCGRYFIVSLSVQEQSHRPICTPSCHAANLKCKKRNNVHVTGQLQVIFV